MIARAGPRSCEASGQSAILARVPKFTSRGSAPRRSRLSTPQSQSHSSKSTGARAPSSEMRQPIEHELQDAQRALGPSRTREQQLRNREAELQQMILAEDARWNDLVSRMEPAIKR